MHLNYEFSLRNKRFKYSRDHFKLVFLMATYCLSKHTIFLDETLKQDLANMNKAGHKAFNEQFEL